MAWSSLWQPESQRPKGAYLEHCETAGWGCPKILRMKPERGPVFLRFCRWEGTSDLTADVTSEVRDQPPLPCEWSPCLLLPSPFPLFHHVSPPSCETGWSLPAEEEAGWRKIVVWPRSKQISGRTGTQIWIWGLQSPCFLH